jgi:uncharacterized protein YycO
MIRIRFSRGSGVAGGVVRFATWSWCAHVGFRFPDGSVLDATPEYGVSERVPEDDDTTRYFAIDAPSATQYRAIGHARTMLGRPYDWRGIFGFAFRRDWHADNSFFCSELVAWAMEKAGAPLLRADKLNRITPRDLLLSPRLHELGA